MKQAVALLLLGSVLSVANGQVSFSTVPESRQVVPRNLQTNEGTLHIAGTVTFAGTPYDKIKVKKYRAGVLQTTHKANLNYVLGVASFNMDIPIAAELAEYKIKIFGRQGATDILLKTVDSLLAGDAFIIQGQSNGVAQKYQGSAAVNESEFIRAYTSTTYEVAPFKWYNGKGNLGQGTTGNVGQWGIRMARMLMDTFQVPLAIFNGASGGQPINFFQRDDADPFDDGTNYGRLLQRIYNTGFENNIRTIFWYQGESDAVFGTTINDYKNYFNSLHDDWSSDFPGFEHLYIIQIRQGCGANTTNVAKIMEAHRQLSEEIPGSSIFGTNGITHHTDGCHYQYNSGYKLTGGYLFKLVARDVYGGASYSNIESPYVVSAAQTAPDQITLTLKNAGDTYTWESGTHDGFKIEGSSKTVTNGSISGSTVILQCSGTLTSFTGITYRDHAAQAGSPTIRNASGEGLVGFYDFPVSPLRLETTAVNAIAPGNELMVYPNPSTHLVHVAWDAPSGGGVISVLNPAGIKVFEQYVNDPGKETKSVVLDVSPFAHGVYFIEFRNETAISRAPLVIE